jgi:FkbM family methyltransferase
MNGRNDRSAWATRKRRLMLLRSLGPVGLVALRQLRTKRPPGTHFKVNIGRGRSLLLRAGTKDKAVFKQHFMDRELFLVPRHPDPRVILDLGAHVGIATEVFRRQYPDARIVSVEMDEGSFRLCEENHRSDEKQTTVRAAVWSSSGLVHIVDPGKGNWGYRAGALPPDATSGAVSLGSVVAVTFGDLLREFGIERVSVLKVDIEGAEAELFENAWRDIFSCTDLVLVEIHAGVPGCEERVTQALDEARDEFDLEVSMVGEFTVIRPLRKSLSKSFEGQAVNA